MDLTKLTVPQLKAICKERQITGYSKLAKAALLQKLTNHSNSGIGTPTSSTTITNPALPETSTVSVEPDLAVETAASVVIKKPRAPKKPKKFVRSSSPSIQQRPFDIQVNDSPVLRAQHVTSNPANHGTSDSTNPPVPCENNAVQHGIVLSRRKRSADLLEREASTPDESSKKQKTLQTFSADSLADSLPQPFNIVSAQNSTRVSKQSSMSVPPPPPPKPTKPQIDFGSEIVTHPQSVARSLNQPLLHTPNPKTARVHTSSISAQTSNNLNTTLAPRQTIQTDLIATLPKGKRFKPLVLRKDVPFPHAVSVAMPHKITSHTPISTLDATFSSLVPRQHLDFSHLPFDSLVLSPITLPPKLSNRKYVHRWSVILSGLSNEERRQCSLVSRMFRYSVYLSAVRLLEQNFNGRRLAHLLLKYPQNVTNMWPYLRQRELEVKNRMYAYKESFLAKYFRDSDPIAERLRTSPDNEKQMIVAVRFILTRLWFLISIGGGNDPLAWSRGIVVDAQEVVKNEIWTVTVQTASSQPGVASQVEIFYVLEQTCEVVGHPLPPAHPTGSSVVSDRSAAPSNTKQIRPDWSAYIAHRQLPASAQDSPPSHLLAHLKWQNHEEYHRGISKLWLKRIVGEGELGSAKRIVADRYVLACVFGNSVSGRWMSSTQMEQDFAGNSAIIPARTQSQQVHLFLPAHHHVESLHFTAANGRPLHVALAIVQTPGREYYILRDNGAQVGCGLGEEDGVAPVWMELLGCTALGET